MAREKDKEKLALLQTIYPTYDTTLILNCTPCFFKNVTEINFLRNAVTFGRVIKCWNGVSKEVLRSLFM